METKPKISEIIWLISVTFFMILGLVGGIMWMVTNISLSQKTKVDKKQKIINITGKIIFSVSWIMIILLIIVSVIVAKKSIEKRPVSRPKRNSLGNSSAQKVRQPHQYKLWEID